MNSERGVTSRYAGYEFEKLIAMSWEYVPGSWRMKISDTRKTDKPADELVLLNKYRLLIEAKCTSNINFDLSLLDEGQIKGLLAFEKCNNYNLGLVMINFTYNDSVFAVRMYSIIQELRRIHALSIPSLHFGGLKVFPCMEIYRKNGLLDLTTFEDRIGELYACDC